MTPEEVLSLVGKSGLQIRADGDRLIVSPASELSAELRALLVEHKDELLRLVGDGFDAGTLWHGGLAWTPPGSEPRSVPLWRRRGRGRSVRPLRDVPTVVLASRARGRS